MQFKGTVKSMRMRMGSKSEHEAMVLVTARGKQYKLRRPGGNAFRDEVLVALQGQEISGEGELINGELFISAWKTEAGK